MNLDPELTERMVAFFRWFQDPHSLPAWQHWPDTGNNGWRGELDAICKLLPPPVDPDIEEARKIVSAWKSGGGATDLALAGIKLGRKLERGE